MKTLLQRITRLLRPRINTRYRVVSRDSVTPSSGWLDPAVAARQHAQFERLLAKCRHGDARIDLLVAARAVSDCGLQSPSIIEVGCGSGYYAEALRLLLKEPFSYIGVDYSTAMTYLGKKHFPSRQFITGDGARLPLAAGSCDILISGTSLMHIIDYRDAIAESARVSRQWCIFHTVPILEKRDTTILEKRGYGQRMSEVIINREELEWVFHQNAMRISSTYDSIEYDLFDLLGEHTKTITYRCEIL